MRVSELIGILSKANPDASIYIQDDEYCNVSDSTFADIAPSGNVFIHYDNWYMKHLENLGHLKRKKKKTPKKIDTSSWDNIKEDPFVGGGW